MWPDINGEYYKNERPGIETDRTIRITVSRTAQPATQKHGPSLPIKPLPYLTLPRYLKHFPSGSCTFRVLYLQLCTYLPNATATGSPTKHNGRSSINRRAPIPSPPRSARIQVQFPRLSRHIPQVHPEQVHRCKARDCAVQPDRLRSLRDRFKEGTDAYAESVAAQQT